MGNDDSSAHGVTDTKKEAELRQHAMRLAGQLPSDPADARWVINYMVVLLNDFMGHREPDQSDARLRVVASREGD